MEALVHAVEDERLPFSRVEDALKRQQRAKERFLAARHRGEAEGRQGAAAGPRPRRAPGDCRRNGSLRVMRKPRALVEGDRIAIVAPASPFDRDEFERGVEEIKRLGFLPVYDESVFARRAYVAGAARPSGRRVPGRLGRSRHRRRHRRAGRLRFGADPAAPRRACRAPVRQVLHRLQRSHRAAHVPDADLRRGGVSRADAGKAARQRRGRLRPRLVPPRRLPGGADGRNRPGNRSRPCGRATPLAFCWAAR